MRPREEEVPLFARGLGGLASILAAVTAGRIARLFGPR
jgi:hypothetical protein